MYAVVLKEFADFQYVGEAKNFKFIKAGEAFDFHSAPIAQEPFLVAEQKAVAFFSQLGIRKIMTGWGKFSSGAIGGDTENYRLEPLIG